MEDDRPIESALMNASIDPRDDLLRRLAEGGLTDDERHRLETEAAQDPEFAGRLALYAPLGPSAVTQLESIAHTAAAKRGWRWAGATGALAAAAAIAFMMIMPRSTPLPPHSVYLEGGQQADYRAVNASAGPTTLNNGPTPVVWRVVPEEAPDGDTALSVAVLGDIGWQELTVPSRRTRQGVFLIEGTVANIFDGHGDARRLRFIVVPGSRPANPIEPLPNNAWVHETDLSLRSSNEPG